jgi:excisionase family DNA binding protein
LSSADVAKLLRLSVRTVLRLLKKGELPEPIRYNQKLIRWRAVDIERYIANL